MFVTDVKSLSSVKYVVLFVFFYGSVGSRLSKWGRRSSILCITHSGEGKYANRFVLHRNYWWTPLSEEQLVSSQ
jgi:hypothetical protein